MQIMRTDEEMQAYKEACQFRAEELGLKRLPLVTYVKSLIDADLKRISKIKSKNKESI
jgi:hypothetical protein